MFFPTEDEGGEVPRVVMKNRFEVLDELLHHGLHHHPVVVHSVLTHHDGALALVTERGHQTSL